MKRNARIDATDGHKDLSTCGPPAQARHGTALAPRQGRKEGRKGGQAGRAGRKGRRAGGSAQTCLPACASQPASLPLHSLLQYTI